MADKEGYTARDLEIAAQMGSIDARLTSIESMLHQRLDTVESKQRTMWDKYDKLAQKTQDVDTKVNRILAAFAAVNSFLIITGVVITILEALDKI